MSSLGKTELRAPGAMPALGPKRSRGFEALLSPVDVLHFNAAKSRRMLGFEFISTPFSTLSQTHYINGLATKIRGEIMKAIITPFHRATFAIGIMLGLASAELSTVVAQDLSFVPTTYTVGRSPNWVLATNLTAGTNLDLVSANTDDDTLTVLTNDGTGNFVVSATLDVGYGPTCVVATDLRGSGKPDLVSVNYDDDTLTVLTNDGSGNFAISAAPKVGVGLWCAVAADLRGTGHPDLVCANYDNNTLLVLTNDGSGNLASNVTITVGKGPTSLVAVDLRGTGRPDVVCANYDDDTLTVLTNNGAGNLGFHATVPAGWEPACVTAADLRGTGKPDLVCANYGDNNLMVLTNNGSGQFALKTTLGIYRPYFVIATDLRGIGRQDVIGAAYESSALLIYTNDGQGNFAYSWNWGIVNGGYRPACIAAADVSGRGKLALISADSGYKTLTVQRQDAPPRIDDQPQSQFPFPGSNVVFGASVSGIKPLAYQWQFNGTNLADDIRISGSQSDQLSIADVQASDVGSYQLVVTNIYGKAASQAVPLAVAHPPGIYFGATNYLVNYGYSEPRWVVATNITGGPKVDLVLALLNNTALFVMTNDGGGNYEFDGCIFGSAPSCNLMAGDLNGMGRLDLVCANYNDAMLTVFTNDGCGNVTSNATLFAGYEPCGVVAADLRGTGRLDLVCANHGDDTLTVFTNDSHGHFGYNATLPVGAEPSCVTAADLHGMGKPDLVCANEGEGTLMVLTNDGTGGFVLNATLTVGAAPKYVIAADLGGTGTLALVCVNSGDNTLMVLTNNGSGGFKLNARIQVGASPDCVVAADLRGTGKPDLVTANYADNTLTVLTNDGTGHFGYHGTLHVGAEPTCVTAADIGGWGKTTLITADSGGGTLTVLRQDVPPMITAEPQSQAAPAGGTACFNVGVVGALPIGFQWLVNGTNLTISPPTSLSPDGELTITNVQTGNVGTYQVVMTNFYGSATSHLVALQLQPTITPAAQTVFIGNQATWSANGSCVGPMSYQWQCNGTNVACNIISVVAGNGDCNYYGDGGPATNAALCYPQGVAMDSQGNLFIADTESWAVRKVDTNGIITTVAGDGGWDYDSDGVLATNASVYSPKGVAVDGKGNLFIADTSHNRIRKVDTNGIITTVAGNGGGGFNGDGGPATNATLGGPVSIAVAGDGTLFIADEWNYRVRRVDTNGVITTVAGNGERQDWFNFVGSGIATNIPLGYLRQLALDNTGELLIVDNHVLRRLFSNGYTEVLAGDGYSGTSGDGGLATVAELDVPGGVAPDSNGRVYVTDAYGIRLTYTFPDCNIYSLDLAGGGGWDFLGNVALDPTGQRLFVTDTWHNRIWMVNLANAPTLNQTITTPGQAGNYSVVAIGPYGSVTSSAAVFAVSGIVQNNDGSVTVGFAGEPDSPATLWMATNLVPPVVWEPIATNDNLGPDGVWTFTDTNAPSAPQRFYLLSTP